MTSTVFCHVSYFAAPQPWTAAMEATVFTGWIYDHLKPHAAALKVAHPICRAVLNQNLARVVFRLIQRSERF
jgi:hypothetical protein